MTAYMDLFLRKIAEPRLLNIFLKFLLLGKMEDVTVLDALVQRITSANTRVSIFPVVLTSPPPPPITRMFSLVLTPVNLTNPLRACSPLPSLFASDHQAHLRHPKTNTNLQLSKVVSLWLDVPWILAWLGTNQTTELLGTWFDTAPVIGGLSSCGFVWQ